MVREEILQEQVVKLALLRQDAEYVSAEIERIDQIIAESPLGQSLVEHVEELKDIKLQADQLRTLIDHTAIAEFGDTEEKQVHPAVQVQEKNVYTIEEEEMLKHALDSGMSSLVSLNKRNATAYAKSGVCPGDLYDHEVELKVAVKRDLTEFIPTPDGELDTEE